MDLYYLDSAQHIITVGQDLDDLSVDDLSVNELSVDNPLVDYVSVDGHFLPVSLHRPLSKNKIPTDHLQIIPTSF